MLDAWLAGEPVTPTSAAAALQQRLLAASLVHPVRDGAGRVPNVAFVIPVYDDVQGLTGVLRALRREFAEAPIVVVDDASPRRVALAAAAEEHGAELIRLSVNRGPAAARNTGWRSQFAASTSNDCAEVVFFVDADVIPTPGAVSQVLAHFDDEQVVAVAPRVAAQPGMRLVDSYEMTSSPLDLGDLPGIVRPGNQPSYVPSAAFAIRATTLHDAGGFDEHMRFGEDVDLVWRLTAQQHMIRYEPRAIVRHRNRSTLAALARQRFSYGSSAASLATRHGDTVTPLRMPAAILGSWLLGLLGGPLGRIVALAGAGWSFSTLTKKLDGRVEQPAVEAARILSTAHRGVAGALVNAATRHYAPVLLLWRPTRRLLGAAAVVAPLASWLRHRPRHDPLRHIALRALDDASYAAGVWAGAWRERSLGALLPVVTFPSRAQSPEAQS